MKKEVFGTFLVAALLLSTALVSAEWHRHEPVYPVGANYTSLDADKRSAVDYAMKRGWSLPTYSVGWEVLLARASSECTYTRPATDNRVAAEFYGVWYKGECVPTGTSWCKTHPGEC